MLFSWLVMHAANLINLYEVGKDGRVPYQRLRGRKLHPEMIEFGECVHYLPLNKLEIGKAKPRDGKMELSSVRGLNQVRD